MKKNISLIVAGFLFAANASAAVIGPDSHDTYNQPQGGDAAALAIAQGGDARSTAYGGSALNLTRVSVELDPKFFNTALNLNELSQAQQMSGSNNAAQVVNQNFEVAKPLPSTVSAPAGDTRAPELELNAEKAMIEAMNTEIDQTLGKALLETFNYSLDGCTAAVSYSATECSVHVYPTGSSKGITPNKLERCAYKAAASIGMRLTKVVTRYVSIEKHANGLGSGATGAPGISDPVSTAVIAAAATVTGSKTHASQRPRAEVVWLGQK